MSSRNNANVLRPFPEIVPLFELVRKKKRIREM